MAYLFGNIAINSTLSLRHFWRIKIVAVAERFHYSSFIGISSYNGSIDEYKPGSVSSEYLYSGVSYKDDINVKRHKQKGRGDRYGTGDIVEIELDLKLKRVLIWTTDKDGKNEREKVKNNNKCIGTGSDVKYRLLVIINQHERVKILDYYTKSGEKFKRKRQRKWQNKNCTIYLLLFDLNFICMFF